jgi:sigma-B regulation protein RsbU (phosphoserine phosphatase)
MKRKGLFEQFGKLILAFALISIVLSGAMTYFNQTEFYHKDCEDDLLRLTSYLSTTIESEGDEFANLKSYFKDHYKELEISTDVDTALPLAESEFLKYFADHYPGRTFDVDVKFADLDEEAKHLYVTYRFLYWHRMFRNLKDKLGLEYVYFIYSNESKDHMMVYMFDPTTSKTEDGREIFNFGDEVHYDPTECKYMWQAWDTGEPPTGYDSFKNQYGYVYTLCNPVYSAGEKVGLICADINVYTINNQLIVSVIRQMLVTIIALVLATAILYYFLKNKIIDRVIKLEGDVAKYSGEKNPEIAEQIIDDKGRDDELGSLAQQFADMIVDLDDYMVNLQKVTAEKERIGAELNVATQIQADMLPRNFPAFPERKEFDLYATMTPAKEVGGDFYDFFLVDDDHLALVIADVSGKGVPAALFMVIAKSLIKNRVLMGETPSEALRNVNEQLCEGNEAELFVTVWLAIIDLNTGHVVEANAGHEHPAIRKKDGVYELHKTKHSPAVATMEGMRFRQTEFDLEPGDMVYVYTDGVTEATDAHNVLYGEKRMLVALNNNTDKDPTNLLPAVREDIDEFVGDAPQFDDITMLCMIYMGPDNDNEE